MDIKNHQGKEKNRKKKDRKNRCNLFGVSRSISQTKLRIVQNLKNFWGENQ